MISERKWKRRVWDYGRAVAGLREPVVEGFEALSALEREGVARRFAWTLDLAWRTLKDYLERTGTHVEPATPQNVIAKACATRIVEDGQVWIDMLNHRELLSSADDASACEAIVEAIRERHLPALEELHTWILERG